jgi:hypothetical protein
MNYEWEGSHLDLYEARLTEGKKIAAVFT